MGMTTNRGAIAVAVAVAVALSGCNKPAVKPGNAEVYKRIEALTDCKALQGEFDTASAGHDRASNQAQREATSGYMAAADDRMKAIGCYR